MWTLKIFIVEGFIVTSKHVRTAWYSVDLFVGI
jgi:hypothetical protein